MSPQQIPAEFCRIEGSERRIVRGARLVGPADPNKSLSVSIRVRRRRGAPPLLDMDYWARTPPNARKAISREEFAATYGADPADLAAIAAFADSYNLRVLESSIPRRTVVVSGTVAEASRAFAVELCRYKSPTQVYRGREGYVHLPENIADIVEGVFGLDNRRMVRRHSGGPKGASPLTPPQVAALYGFPMELDATGVTIALIEFDPSATRRTTSRVFFRN